MNDKAGKLTTRKEEKRVSLTIAEIEKCCQKSFSAKEKTGPKLPETPCQSQEISIPPQETFITGAISFHCD